MRSEACDPSQEEPNIELEIASYINTHLQAQPEFFYIQMNIYRFDWRRVYSVLVYTHGAKIYYTYVHNVIIKIRWRLFWFSSVLFCYRQSCLSKRCNCCYHKRAWEELHTYCETYSRSACVCIAFPHTYNMKPAHLTAQPAIVYPSSFPAPTPPCYFV